jgi:cobalt-zinc-cadmium efflux system outer membrane protein
VSRAAVLFVVAVLALSACTSTPPPPTWRPTPRAAIERALTLEDALALARAGDLRAASWAARRALAHAALTTATAIPNPTFSLEWEGLGLGHPGPSLKAGISYPVLAWIPRREQIRAAARGEEEALLDVLVESRRLDAQVASSWIGLLADQRRVAVLRRGAEDARGAVEIGRKALEAGAAPRRDVDRAEADALAAEGDAQSAEATLRLDQLAFAFALGADGPAYPRAAEDGPPPDLEPLEGSDEPPPRLLEEALAHDPSWRKARAGAERAESELHVQQLGAIPFTGVVAGVQTKNEPGTGASRGATFETPLPLFDRNAGGIEDACAALASARAAAEEARRAVASDVASGWERLRSASARWRTISKPLLAMRRAWEADARRLWERRDLDVADWLQAQRDLRAAERDEIDAWKDAATARLALEFALGLRDAPVPTSTEPCVAPPPSGSAR